MAAWFFYDNKGKKTGPVANDLIVSLVKDKFIPADTKVFAEDGREMLASDVQPDPQKPRKFFLQKPPEKLLSLEEQIELLRKAQAEMEALLPQPNQSRTSRKKSPQDEFDEALEEFKAAMAAEMGDQSWPAKQERPNIGISVELTYRDQYGEYSIEKLHKWIRDLGWMREIPENPREAREVYIRLARESRPSSKQIEFLRDLGYHGDAPENVLEATLLINKHLMYRRAAENNKYPATERQIEFLEEIAKEIGDDTDIRSLNLLKGNASVMIDELLPRFNKAREEREKRESESRQEEKEKEKRERDIQKLKERFVKQIDKLIVKNNGSDQRKPADDPFEAVKIVNKIECIHANKEYELILLEDALNNIPPYIDCPEGCNMGCRFEGVRQSRL